MLKKISILLGTSLSLFFLWIIGLEKIYAKILDFGTTLLLSPFSSITTVLNTDNAHPHYCIAVGKEGYCMEMELFGLSIIMLLSWYILLLVLKPNGKMLLTSLKHLAMFYLLQVFTISTLALYEYGVFFQQMNSALKQSFIIIALIFIIRDNYIYEIFNFKEKKQNI